MRVDKYELLVMPKDIESITTKSSSTKLHWDWPSTNLHSAQIHFDKHLQSLQQKYILFGPPY